MTLPAALAVAGTAFGALGANANAKSQANMSKYNSDVALQNAEQAKKAAAVEAKEIRQDTRRRIGSMRANAAAGGVLTTEGSPLLATLSQRAEGELEAKKRIYAGNLEAQGQRRQAAIDRAQATGFKRQGQRALISGAVKTAGVANQHNLLQ